MVHIGICEDDSKDLVRLEALIEQTLVQHDEKVQMTAFRDGEALLKTMQAGAVYDLLLLDIFLPGMNGVETARQARMLQSTVALAFLTTSREYAVDAYALDALHYLVKPVDAMQLQTLFTRYEERVGRSIKRVVIQSNGRTYHFQAHQLRRIQSCNKSVELYLDGSNVPLQLTATFSSIEEQLDSTQFLKLSRGYIVNMDDILFMDRDRCRLKDGSEVLLSRRDRDDIYRRYNDFLFRTMEVET